MNKSKTPSSCGFPLANLYFDQSVDFVPPPTVLEDHQTIAYCINQSSIFAPPKIEQQ
jgi:hypothetical protein